MAYEGLPNICSLCGMYGHLVHNCPRRVRETVNSTVLPGIQGNGRGKKVVQVEETFTQVRRGRGRQMEVVRHDEGGKNAPRADKKSNTRNILLRNRFGNLEENMEVGEFSEALPSGNRDAIVPRVDTEPLTINRGNGNKENIDPVGAAQREKSVAQGKGIVFGSGSSKGPTHSRAALKGRKTTNGKSVDLNRPKPSFLTRPTRGLIFGPTIGKTALLENGKRLRVEQVNLGRSGGFVATEGIEPRENGVETRGESEISMEVQLGDEMGSLTSELGIPRSSSAKLAEKNGA